MRAWAGRWRVELTAQVLHLKGTTCHLCKRPGATTADHVVPRSQGGPDTLDNLMPAHQACNASRGVMTLAEWFGRHPVQTRTPLPPSRRWATQ